LEELLEVTLVFADDVFTIGTTVLHILETVHTEWETEAGPQHGEAEDGRQAPGHQAGPATGAGGYIGLTIGTNCLHRVWAKVWGG